MVMEEMEEMKRTAVDNVVDAPIVKRPRDEVRCFLREAQMNPISFIGVRRRELGRRDDRVR